MYVFISGHIFFIINRIRKEDALICTVGFISYGVQVYLIES